MATKRKRKRTKRTSSKRTHAAPRKRRRRRKHVANPAPVKRRRRRRRKASTALAAPRKRRHRARRANPVRKHHRRRARRRRNPAIKPLLIATAKGLGGGLIGLLIGRFAAPKLPLTGTTLGAVEIVAGGLLGVGAAFVAGAEFGTGLAGALLFSGGSEIANEVWGPQASAAPAGGATSSPLLAGGNRFKLNAGALNSMRGVDDDDDVDLQMGAVEDIGLADDDDDDEADGIGMVADIGAIEVEDGQDDGDQDDDDDDQDDDDDDDLAAVWED